MSWLPLTVHSQFSILQSTINIKALLAKAKEMDYSAVGLTDSGNLYGSVDFYKLAIKEGIQPIIGSKMYLSHGDHREKSRTPGYPNSSSLFLLAKNAQGYRNLCKLSSIAFLEGFYYVPRIDKELLFEYSEGLICLAGGLGSYLSFYALEQNEHLEDYIDLFSRAFGQDFYLQLENYEMSEDCLTEDGLTQETWLLQRYQNEQETRKCLRKFWAEIGNNKGIGVIASHESCYLSRSDWRAHEVLMNVQSGETLEIWQFDEHGQPSFKQKNPKRDVLASHEHYFKSREEVQRAFQGQESSCFDLCREIAQKCDFHFDFKSKHYPCFVLPSEYDSSSSQSHEEKIGQYLSEKTRQLVSHRYDKPSLKAIAEVYPNQDPMDVLTQRLEDELNIIVSKGLADYLLIVADFIQWAKSQNIPVGPGRGSGAGSIICYLLGITDIEPLRFHLFFERFINPERESYPDIDVDICMDRRSEVIDYMLRKYGRDNVAQIITFGTMKAKMSIKDVGRVLNIPLSKVNEIAKLFPDDLNITLQKVIEDPDLARLYESDEQTRELFDMAKVLEGCIRNTGIHAAGLIICAQPLVQHIPLCVSKDAAMPVTQYSMKPAESVGMLKIDFLGLKTLTSIQTCVDALHKDHGVKIDWMNLPLDDEKTFALLNKGKTLGVFQMESAGMQDLARQLHLDRFEEIIAVVSLYRPGPMDMIPSFIARKHGREKIEYDHPWLKDILSETYGIMVYQEQVMQIASRLAGFTLAQGDVLRRAMGKKDAEEMGRQRLRFLEGAQEKGISSEVATTIFDKMEKFASYGFNKSHAAAYGYIAYVTAYLKAHYPAEWMAALMTCDRDDISKVSKFIAEARSMGIEILPPDINESGINFTAAKKGIRFALSAIKGVGQAVVEELVDERRKNGLYSSLYDFIHRSNLKKISRKVAECLIDAGGFDFTQWSRDHLLAIVDPVFQRVAKAKDEESRGFMNLFSLSGHDEAQEFSSPPELTQVRDQAQLYLREKELLGFYLTGNPLQSYQEQISRLHCVPLNVLQTLDRSAALRVAFIIDEVVIKVSQRTQKKFAVLKVSDGQERYELPIWSDIYEKFGARLKENAIFLAVILAENKMGLRLSCRWLLPIEEFSPTSSTECDEAYDKTKEFLARALNRPEKKNHQGKNKQADMKQLKQLTIDTRTLRLSQVLYFSELIKQNPGMDKIKLKFTRGPQGEHYIHLRTPVEWKKIEKKLAQMQSIIEIK